ncbi:MAG: hypothetical protein LBL15_04720, partial [Oscillospiraceae bacterium]|nr:hypothetical protein [Oscillospiraceae bacterium]
MRLTKKIIHLILCLAFITAAFSGCGNKTKVETLTLTNSSSWKFEEIYIAPFGLGVWGPDLLGSTAILKTDSSVEITLEAVAENGVYNLRCVDEDGDAWIIERVTIQNGDAITVQLNDDGDPSAVLESKKDGRTVQVNGIFEYANGSDPEEDFADALISFTLYNDSSYNMMEVYFAPGGTIDARDQAALGYNHVAGITYLAAQESTEIICDNFGFTDVLLLDEDDDVWTLKDCILEEGCTAYIEGGQTLRVRYA